MLVFDRTKTGKGFLVNSWDAFLAFSESCWPMPWCPKARVETARAAFPGLPWELGPSRRTKFTPILRAVVRLSSKLAGRAWASLQNVEHACSFYVFLHVVFVCCVVVFVPGEKAHEKANRKTPPWKWHGFKEFQQRTANQRPDGREGNGIIPRYWHIFGKK